MAYNISLYNVSGIVSGNNTGLLTMVQGVSNNLMGGWLGNLFLLGVYVVLLIAFYTNSGDMNRSLMASSFIIFLLSMPLIGLGLVHPWVLLAALIMTGIGVATSWKD